MQALMFALKWIPVVVVSNSIAPDVEAAVLRLGASAFLRKPIDAQALHAALSRSLLLGTVDLIAV